ncbi:hypothetical protein N657DRAFT_572969 [Parathielavia appendiculata]|uniref:Uncharacterized protein n=1 Tax=Parathielavia appendiculata TaxID=2587402 RepID=A0AAN6TZX7_9PEZI|nr:hypothetical protein N657DRAFT_572969 [Parathielavia appendiculata]
MERKKIVHTLDTPYSVITWPRISQDDQDAILELLCHPVFLTPTCMCRLLAPLGLYRRTFITPSKGKRKRFNNDPSSETPASSTQAPPVPPPPELAAHVDVGLSAISRTLQAMSGKNEAGPSSIDAPAKRGKSDSKPNAKPYTVVFVARSGQSPAFNCHFPQMVAVAAQSQLADKAIRLVGFSKACEDRLSAALGIPRVSSIALREDAPQAKGLVDFVREHVAPIEVPWLQEAQSGRFLETKIDAVATKVGTKKPKPS